jgi:hypothetical protein
MVGSDGHATGAHAVAASDSRSAATDDAGGGEAGAQQEPDGVVTATVVRRDRGRGPGAVDPIGRLAIRKGVVDRRAGMVAGVAGVSVPGVIVTERGGRGDGAGGHDGGERGAL